MKIQLQRLINKVGGNFRMLTMYARIFSMSGDQQTAKTYYDDAMKKMHVLNKLQNWLREFNK